MTEFQGYIILGMLTSILGYLESDKIVVIMWRILALMFIIFGGMMLFHTNTPVTDNHLAMQFNSHNVTPKFCKAIINEYL